MQPSNSRNSSYSVTTTIWKEHPQRYAPFFLIQAQRNDFHETEIEFLIRRLLTIQCQTRGELHCPRSPEHGQAFLYQEGQVVKYVCEPGYTLLGKEIVRCVEGEWEAPFPICLEVTADGDALPLDAAPELSQPRSAPSSVGEGRKRRMRLQQGDEPQGDEARLRMVIYPRRRIFRSRVARLRSAAELEDEERKRSAKKDDDKSTSSSTTIHLQAPPSVVYVRRTVSPGKSESQEKTLTEQYRTAAVHMTVDNSEDKLQVVALPRAAVSQNDKGDESLRHLYWMAQQYYPRHASLMEYRSGNPVVMTLSESQMAWINSLHPELRDQYLKDLYVLRAEEAVEGARALSFLRRYDDAYIRQPLIAQDLTPIYDYSCNQAGSHFVTAPKLPNAHIARYDRRQNPNHPYQHYLAAVYRCNPGYVMLDTRFTELTCSRRSWIGTDPICVPH
ncbi:uncharacterized protein CEXT_160921 [Caerostris extrusa]|uniref:Sushi domain-containing protein n=1 Tax=Caerostris extrusa TaxID=172846 RepID=A0AAV4W971_CAEEX|nr:uncharacterized protein CEXT_160921 [Caerostris extrusa]